MDDYILKTHGLSRYFAGVKALDNVSLSIRRGEVHAICGENGAGKSTLIKLLTGANVPVSGTIEFEGIVYTKLEPRQAMNLGITVIYQEFSLIPYLSVAENIFLGREIHNYGIRNVKKMNKDAQALCDRMGVKIDIHARICDLGVAYQEIVEILKAVSQQSKFIIMDEPTAPLTLNETEIFFGIIKKLKENNTTIVFISHRLEEVFDICDRVTVLCDGKFVTTQDVANINKKQLISFMVGRELAEDYPVPANAPSAPVFEAKNLSSLFVHNASFALRQGEILGFSGLVGAGRTELARIIFGVDKKTGGNMLYRGKPYNPASPRDALADGIGLIPEDRKNQGIIQGLSVKDNIVYSALKNHAKYTVINRSSERETVDMYIRDLNIRTPSRLQLIRNLSGGNQQKVVLAKMLATNCDILIFDEPTRGIDVGAKQEIYHLMCQFIDMGKSIIMISSEMPELIGMSHRILVMSGGKICGELQRHEFSQETILEMASSNLFKEGA
ncbi:MAG: sugar ABC transporter ATP-binding protein [Treponema sp.]|jgi:ribose transport system ATP-binding protein|nr:sugar ABC transporter ATP-binding protein [Treponema sp.]